MSLACKLVLGNLVASPVVSGREIGARPYPLQVYTDDDVRYDVRSCGWTNQCSNGSFYCMVTKVILCPHLWTDCMNNLQSLLHRGIERAGGHYPLSCKCTVLSITPYASYSVRCPRCLLFDALLTIIAALISIILWRIPFSVAGRQSLFI